MEDLKKIKNKLAILEKSNDWDVLMAYMIDDVKVKSDPKYAALMFDEAILLYRNATGPEYLHPLGKLAGKIGDAGNQLYRSILNLYSNDSYCLWRIGECLNAGPGYSMFLDEEIQPHKNWHVSAMSFLEKSLRFKESYLVQLELSWAAFYAQNPVDEMHKSKSLILSEEALMFAEAELLALNLQDNWVDEGIAYYYTSLIAKERKLREQVRVSR